VTEASCNVNNTKGIYITVFVSLSAALDIFMCDYNSGLKTTSKNLYAKIISNRYTKFSMQTRCKL
jgi:hypothetical protein